MSTPEPTTPGAVEELSPCLYYTPGYAWQKLAMVLFGLTLFAFGMTYLWTPLRLLVLGARSTAEATRVIKATEGLPELILSDDLQIKARQEGQNRHSVFWNEFRFQTETGREILVRAPIGSQLKPLYPLLDNDGLPTTAPIIYDPRHPETVAFPAIFSTWFFPGAMAFLGLLCAIIGAVLFYWANKPIELPNLPSGKLP